MGVDRDQLEAQHLRSHQPRPGGFEDGPGAVAFAEVVGDVDPGAELHVVEGVESLLRPFAAGGLDLRQGLGRAVLGELAEPQAGAPEAGFGVEVAAGHDVVQGGRHQLADQRHVAQLAEHPQAVEKHRVAFPGDPGAALAQQRVGALQQLEGAAGVAFEILGDAGGEGAMPWACGRSARSSGTRSASAALASTRWAVRRWLLLPAATPPTWRLDGRTRHGARRGHRPVFRGNAGHALELLQRRPPARPPGLLGRDTVLYGLRSRRGADAGRVMARGDSTPKPASERRPGGLRLAEEPPGVQATPPGAAPQVAQCVSSWSRSTPRPAGPARGRGLDGRPRPRRSSQVAGHS